MKPAWTYVSGLLDLPATPGIAEQRAMWRQSMATLARAASDGTASPLEGLHPEAIAKGVRAAGASGLLDDLDWLAPSAAATALYTLASALPLGAEQREVGRRVLARLQNGTAETVVAVATRMAAAGKKSLGAPGLRVRIALAIELPLGLELHDGPFAYALAQDRDLAREWFAAPSTGSLPERRMAARLLERAAREAARRALQGDVHALRTLRTGAVREAWDRLLRDRESLVWRHVAVARGLVAPWAPEFAKEAREALAANLTATEWRRGATSLAAMLATAPDDASAAISLAIQDGALARDSGVAAAFMWGIPRALEAEPEAAARCLALLSARPTMEGAEGLAYAIAEFGPTVMFERPREAYLKALSIGAQHEDDGIAAMEREIASDLARKREGEPSLQKRLDAALLLFGQSGAQKAGLAAKEIVEAAEERVQALEAMVTEEGSDSGARESRQAALALLRDLDAALLERDVLGNLLRLSQTERPGVDSSRDSVLDSLRDRIATWILARETAQSAHSTPRLDAAPSPHRHVSHPALRLRRLRALLHLLDGDVDLEGDPARAPRLRERWVRSVQALVGRFDAVPPAALRRTLLAALGRALDALVRGGVIDGTDVLLFAATLFDEAPDFATLAEASMDPDLVHAFERYAIFVRAFEETRARASAPPPLRGEKGEVFAPLEIEARLEALHDLARDVAGTQERGEALKGALLRLHEALQAVGRAPSLAALASAGSEPDVATALEEALFALQRLGAGAQSRLDPDAPPVSIQQSEGESLSKILSPVHAGVESVIDEAKVAERCTTITRALPRRIAALVVLVLEHMVTLPGERASIPLALVRIGEVRLPAWVPPRRMLGGFYLVRALGSGASGSVFLVHRHEERGDPGAEKFALKVPDYSGTAARLLSEAEFLTLFRSEASALLSIPAHPNLARFVTFDLGARPKPILVMEFVEGITLEQLIASRALTVARTLSLLEEILAGLSEMHRAGVGHLDLKPSNVVLRNGLVPVLVDFGLAGRHIRPGCATGPYGAPEVWGAHEASSPPSPLPADIYAFGCVAFEAMTGEVLFAADSEMAQIAMHIAHDGVPPRLRKLAERPETSPFAELLFTTLRRDPARRPDVTALGEELSRIGKTLRNVSWPL